jgi:plastocyanin
LLALSMGPAIVDLSGTVSVGTKRATEAVIWLDAPKDAAPVHHPKPVLDQRNISFSPHVIAVQRGMMVEFPNHDRVFHDVFSDHDGQKFNLGLYPVGMIKDLTFDQVGLSRIFCNIHPQMSAYVMVVDTPYYAVADSSGQFTIREVVPGSYTYHAWRPGVAILDGTVTVAPGATLDVRW